MKANFTPYPKAPGDYHVIFGSTKNDYLVFICPCGECKEPVVVYDMDGINWPGTDEFPTISKTLVCPKKRWKGELNTAVVKPDDTVLEIYKAKVRDMESLAYEVESLGKFAAPESSVGEFVDVQG